jgi:hypothetical protein
VLNTSNETAGVVIVTTSVVESKATRGISKPLLTLFTSSIAELSGGVPEMFIDTPCCAEQLKVKS